MRNRNSGRSRNADRAAKSGRDNVTRLHRRAVQAENEVETPSEAPEMVAAPAPAMSIGGLQIPNLGNMEGTVRNVVSYVQENPLAAAAMALGAGMVLTSMYWDQVSDTRGKRRTR